MSMSKARVPWKYFVKWFLRSNGGLQRTKYYHEAKAMRRGIHHRRRQQAKAEIRTILKEMP